MRRIVSTISAGVEAEAVGVARHRVAHRGLEAPVPARQHLGGRLDAAVVHQCSTGLRRSVLEIEPRRQFAIMVQNITNVTRSEAGQSS